MFTHFLKKMEQLDAIKVILAGDLKTLDLVF